MVRREFCGAGSRISQEVWVTDFAMSFEAKKGAWGAPFVFMLTWWPCYAAWAETASSYRPSQLISTSLAEGIRPR